MTTTTSRHEARLRLTPPWVLLYLPGIWVLAVGSVVAPIGLGVAMSGPPSPGDAAPLLQWAWLVFLLVGTPLICGGAVSSTIGFATKRVVLRVDEAGVTLGRGVNLFDRTVTVPWLDLEQIVLYEYYMRYWGHQPFIGVRLRPGAVRPWGIPEPGSPMAWLNRRPAEVSRHVAGWDLDVGQLYAAVQVHGPHVPIVNIGRHGS